MIVRNQVRSIRYTLNTKFDLIMELAVRIGLDVFDPTFALIRDLRCYSSAPMTLVDHTH